MCFCLVLRSYDSGILHDLGSEIITAISYTCIPSWNSRRLRQAYMALPKLNSLCGNTHMGASPVLRNWAHSHCGFRGGAIALPSLLCCFPSLLSSTFHAVERVVLVLTIEDVSFPLLWGLSSLPGKNAYVYTTGPCNGALSYMTWLV